MVKIRLSRVIALSLLPGEKTLSLTFLSLQVNNPFAVLALKRSMDKVFSNEMIVFQILCYVDDFHSMAFARTVCRNWCSTLHSIEKRRGFFRRQVCFSMLFLVKVRLSR
ncbi:hypothetical protein RHMOL_Rhmol05G0044500 [Rhododendron molle]|uniref:Uncharacterized protein n=1 Tax=Rhododendron molle TaxID=49168 RepID=A0ACC0NKL5_RHOML|nr:hypothetical protein RHMOL_Rhmol05G0044500 [Rhododendron molle]